MPTPNVTWTVKWSVYCVRQVWLGTFFSGMLNCSVSWKSDFILQCLSQQFCSYFAYKFKWQMSFFSLRYFTNCVDSKRLNEYTLSEKSFPICVLSIDAVLVPVFQGTEVTIVTALVMWPFRIHEHHKNQNNVHFHSWHLCFKYTKKAFRLFKLNSWSQMLLQGIN